MLVVVLLVVGSAVACTVVIMGASVTTMTASCVAVAEHGQGQGASISITGELPDVPGFDQVQLANAAVVIAAAAERDLGVQGARVGLITAMQESGLRNLANAGRFTYPAGSRVMSMTEWLRIRPIIATSVNYPNDGVAAGDWDSIGLFQGRYSISTWSGEGTPEEKISNLLDPAFTSARFFDALMRVNGWSEMRPAAAAQAVQRSAFPDAYAKHWDKSGVLVEALVDVDVDIDASTGAPGTSAGPCQPEQSAAAVTADGWTHPITAHTALSSPYGMRWHPVHKEWRMHHGQDFSAPRGTPIYAAAAGLVVSAGYAGPGTNDLYWVVLDHGGGVQTRYLHPEADGIFVKAGQSVDAGEQIATVGSSGFSTGPHLHFEVLVNGTTVDPMAFLAVLGVTY